MRITTLLYALVLLSCSTDREEIIGNWNIEEVYDLETKETSPDMGASISFNSDGTWRLMSIVTEISTDGTWIRNADELELTDMDDDAMLCKIESLNDSVLVWTTNDKTLKLRMRLKKSAHNNE